MPPDGEISWPYIPQVVTYFGTPRFILPVLYFHHQIRSPASGLTVSVYSDASAALQLKDMIPGRGEM